MTHREPWRVSTKNGLDSDIAKDSTDRMHAIQRGLNKTHEATYQYKFVWENWRRR